MPRWWRLMGLGICAAVLAACSSSAAVPTTTSTTVNPASIPAINCPNTWQSASAHGGLNLGTSHSVLAAQVVPPHALWVAFCLYEEPSSATSNAAGIETLVQGGGTLASRQQGLITEINDGQVISPHAVYHCPSDNGATYLLLFTYHHAPIVRVAASLSGCRVIANGVITVRSAKATAQLLAKAKGTPGTGPPIPTPTTGP